MQQMRAKSWTQAAQLARQQSPVASDIIQWHALRAGQGDYFDLAGFLQRHPDWPGEPFLRKKSEPAVINAGAQAIQTFFAQYAPQTPEGVLAYAQVKQQNGEEESAKEDVIRAWKHMPMPKEVSDAYLSAFGSVLQLHHETRLQNLLWSKDYHSAKRMFEWVPKAQVNLAQAREALQKKQKNVDARLRAVPEALQNDPGLQFDRFIWRLRKGRHAEAKELLMAQSTSAEMLGRPEEWANRRRSLARDEMRAGNAVRAYKMASQHHLSEGSAFADLEWLSGFIALRQLNDPKRALAHFIRFESAIRSPISKGRAGYWQGRAYQAMGDVAGANRAYLAGAQYQTSYYGLLAAERVGVAYNVYDTPNPEYKKWRESPILQSSVFEAGLALKVAGELDLSERFLTHYAEKLDETQAGQLAQVAIEMGEPHIALMIAKRVAQRGIVLPQAYYPLHSVATRALPMAPEMVLSIARRESEFDPKVQSGVGARGLMQLMPKTAQEVAAGLGRSAQHSTARLTQDPDYNADLGARYLSQMAGRFDGNVILMSAAYNAGPSRPDRWMNEYGDPRTRTDMIDWVEFIPFRETRNYVMRVSESLPQYRARLGKEPLPIPFSQELRGSTLLAFAPEGK